MIFNKKNCSFFLMLIFSSLVFGQENVTIKGSLKTSKGKPINKANISVIGTKIGTTSNKKGEFKFEIENTGSFNLEVSHVKYQKISRANCYGKLYIGNNFLDRTVKAKTKVKWKFSIYIYVCMYTYMRHACYIPRGIIFLAARPVWRSCSAVGILLRSLRKGENERFTAACVRPCGWQLEIVHEFVGWLIT